MIETSFKKIDDNTVEITKIKEEKDLRSKQELLKMKESLETKLASVNEMLGLLK